MELYCAIPSLNRHANVSMNLPVNGLQEEARLATTSKKYSGLSSAVIKRTKWLKKTNPMTHSKLFITVTESRGVRVQNEQMRIRFSTGV